MDFPFNFIIIPGIIIALAYLGRKASKQGFHPWYEKLRKPHWTPPTRLVGDIWLFLYVITGLAILWYWNVPAHGWFKYITGAALLLNAYYYKTWNDVFLLQRDLAKASKVIKYLLITAMVAAVLMVFDSPIAAFLMLPYLVWIGLARQLNDQMLELNK